MRDTQDGTEREGRDTEPLTFDSVDAAIVYLVDERAEKAALAATLGRAEAERDQWKRSAETGDRVEFWREEAVAAEARADRYEKAERERDEALQIRDEVVVMVDRVVTAAEQRATGYREALERIERHPASGFIGDIARQALQGAAPTEGESDG